VLNAGYDIGLLLLNFVGRLYLLQQQLKQKKSSLCKNAAKFAAQYSLAYHSWQLNPESYQQ